MLDDHTLCCACGSEYALTCKEVNIQRLAAVERTRIHGTDAEAHASASYDPCLYASVAYVFTSTHTIACTCLHMYVIHMLSCAIYIYIYIYIRMYVYVCMYVCMYVYVYVCMYV
jgi:hypothetical protein